jgi:hypothetical protein
MATAEVKTMSELRRIDPKRIAEWFQAHPDIHVAQGRFAVLNGINGWGYYDGMFACCGLVSLVADDPGFSLDDMEDLPSQVVKVRLAHALGLSEFYTDAFILGWDCARPLDIPSESERQGYADGRAAYRATMDALATR